MWDQQTTAMKDFVGKNVRKLSLANLMRSVLLLSVPVRYNFYGGSNTLKGGLFRQMWPFSNKEEVRRESILVTTRECNPPECWWGYIPRNSESKLPSEKCPAGEPGLVTPYGGRHAWLTGPMGVAVLLLGSRLPVSAYESPNTNSFLNFPVAAPSTTPATDQTRLLTNQQSRNHNC